MLLANHTAAFDSVVAEQVQGDAVQPLAAYRDGHGGRAGKGEGGEDLALSLLGGDPAAGGEHGVPYGQDTLGEGRNRGTIENRLPFLDGIQAPLNSCQLEQVFLLELTTI